MRHEYYTPDGQPCEYEEWIRLWRDPATKIVKKTKMDGAEISTVYLGMDHGYGDEPPQIFETMVFEDGPMDQACWRYSTKDEALAGHDAAEKRLRFARSCRFADVDS